MQARVKILTNELAAMLGSDVTETQEEAISGMYFARIVSDMPHGTEISDKTARVAASWREQYGKEFHKVWRQFVLDMQNKEAQLRDMKGKLVKINTAIESLLPKERDVVTLFYVQGLKWEDIGKRLSYDPDWCRKLRSRGIWYMSKSIFGKWIVR
jgi:DNA-directed RNA polymerase specialized sigma subunit